MPLYVIDIETDGLVSTKIHVMSIGYLNKNKDWEVYSTKDVGVMKKILTNKDNTIVGHYFKQFDAVELERVLDFEVKAEIFDSLVLSWYIYPKRTIGTYGLEYFGKDFGIKKPKIEDWENLTYEIYKMRCEADVWINIKLWEDIVEKLIELYGSWKLAYRFIKYLMFKTDCLVYQQLNKCRIDMEAVHDNIQYLTPLLKKKEEILIKAMPPGKVIKVKPKVMKKQDGSISANGQKWKDLLKERGLPKKTKEIRDIPNPTSIPQLKDWLFTLDWAPEIFSDGANGPIPQIRDKEKQLCRSVLALAEKEEAINALEGMTVLSHRLGILKAFVDTADYNGYVIAGASGFTNTLRLKHKKPIVNLPRVTNKGDIRDGKVIRECIIATEGKILCGSDIVSLEDQTKRHYMWDYDPDYVTEQMEEGYDPHLDLAVRAGALTQEEVDEHKLYVKSKGKKGVDHGAVRYTYKTANYSCIYKIGVAGLSRATGLTQNESRKLRNDYWERNWSIEELPKDVITKVIDSQLWLLNPLSQYWYSVRSDKDIFSVLNQGSGSFVFDLWISFMNDYGLHPILQYHDEVVLYIYPKKKDYVERALEECMKKVNNILKLNIEIKVDVQFGLNYADVH